MSRDQVSIRAFKTRWFERAARKAAIGDAELMQAVEEAARGQAVDLGGGVLKKRLHRNLHRGIVLMRSGDSYIFVYLFAKKDRDNIRPDELAAFRELAALYAAKSESALAIEVEAGELMEIERAR